MNVQKYDLDGWKDYVLNILIEKGDGSLTDNIWKLLIKRFSLGNNEQKEHYLYTECVLKCLEFEFQLIRTNGRRGVQITEKGKYVAKKGFRSFINSIRRHERLGRVNDYLSTITGFLSITSALISSANMYYGWINKVDSLIPTILFVSILLCLKFCRIERK